MPRRRSATPTRATDRLRPAVESFAGFIRSLPEPALVPRAWGPREVLAHLVFWHETYANTIAALLRDDEPHLLPGTGKELNAMAVRENGHCPPEMLAQRLLAAQARLERLARFGPVRGLAIHTKLRSKPRGYDELARDVAAHVRAHEAKLRRELGLARPKPARGALLARPAAS